MSTDKSTDKFQKELEIKKLALKMLEKEIRMLERKVQDLDPASIWNDWNGSRLIVNSNYSMIYTLVYVNERRPELVLRLLAGEPVDSPLNIEVDRKIEKNLIAKGGLTKKVGESTTVIYLDKTDRYGPFYYFDKLEFNKRNPSPYSIRHLSILQFLRKVSQSKNQNFTL